MTIAMILSHKGQDVYRVSPGSTVATVVAVLARHKIGAVLVLDEAAPRFDADIRHIVGIVSERDIVRALTTAGSAGDVLDMAVSQIMTEARHTIHASATLREAAELMTDRRVRHLPVIEDDKLVGMVSIGDVVKARLDQQETEVESLRAYVAGCV